MGVERKRRVLSAVLAELRREASVIERSARDAWEGATHEENRAEHAKDMRAIEASYVAMGQSARLRELADAIAKVEALALAPWPEQIPADVGALVTLEAEETAGGESRIAVMLVPAGGGVTVADEGVRVRAVTPQAPLGAAVLGATVGDAVTVGARSYEVVSIG
jgi:transcription elongation GreA/GreB family factor